jgi:hypothetical protein
LSRRGRRHRDDEDVRLLQVFEAVAVAQFRGRTQLVGRGFQRAVVAGAQLRQPAGVHVEARHREVLAEFHRQRQADVAKADDGQPGFAGFNAGLQWQCVHVQASLVSGSAGGASAEAAAA